MGIIIGVITLIFTCSAFFFTLPQPTTANALVTYYFLQRNFLATYYLFFLAGFIVLAVIFFRFNFDKKYSSLKILFFSLAQTVIVILTGFFVSFMLLCIVALVQLNIVTLLLNHDPNFVGVVEDKDAIASMFKTDNKSPDIIVSEANNVAWAVAKATSGPTNFYGKYMLSAIPNSLVLPVTQTLPHMLLIDNTLIITEITQKDVQEVGQYIGYLFVKNYFPARKIKSFPKLSVMTRAEYGQLRKQDAYEKLIKIDAAIEQIDEYRSSIAAQLRVPEPKLSLQAKREKQALLDEYNFYFDFFTTQRKRVAELSQNVPHELGVFLPENSIRIIFGKANAHALGDYVETLVHEYLHYTSHISSERSFASAFFEEGLTEYFAREVVKANLGIDTNLGYPVQVAIITQMTKIITASELADIYFAKDEDALERALNRVYGDDFYQNNFILFESLQYASDKKQILKLANEIMKRIGGNPLTEKDLISTYSSL